MKKLPIVPDDGGPDARMALNARWPDPILSLSDAERSRSVRQGHDTVIWTNEGRTRGFVRAVLAVPFTHPKANVYGVFVEVERDAYERLRRAFAEKAVVRVWGRLATRLPHLEAAYGAEVEIEEDGSERRARVVGTKDPLLRNGPPVGPVGDVGP